MLLLRNGTREKKNKYIILPKFEKKKISENIYKVESTEMRDKK